MAADVKRLLCLKLIFTGILICVLIDLSRAQQFRGRSMFPTRWNPRVVLSQKSRSQYIPRTIRIQNPLIERIRTSRFRPIRTQRTFVARNELNSQPIRAQDRFTDMNRGQSRPIDFQIPRLSEVNVPSVQRSMIQERGNNDVPIYLTSRSRSQSPRQIQRMQMISSKQNDPRDQFRQQLFESRQQQVQMRSATAGNTGQRDFAQRTSSLSSTDTNGSRRILQRRISGLPKLSDSKIPRQPIVSMRPISRGMSRSRRTSLRTNVVSKQVQSPILQKSATSSLRARPSSVRNQRLPRVVSRVQPKQPIPMVLSSKQNSKDQTITNGLRLQSQTLIPKLQPQTSVPQQQLQVIVTQNQQMQTGIPQIQQQAPIIVTKNSPIHTAAPEMQQSPLQVSQMTGNVVTQQANTGRVQTTLLSETALPVEGSTAQQSNVQYLPAASSSGVVTSSAVVPSNSGTTDLVFEELVNAFTAALENPSGQQTATVQTNPIIHNMHPQTALQSGIHPQPHPGILHHGGLVQSIGPLQNGMFGGHMHGNQFGFMNPWMMGGMNSDMMQEMMFGDTTDPPDPVASTTTSAPTTAAAVSVNKTSNNLAIVNTSTVFDLLDTGKSVNASAITASNSASNVLTAKTSIIVPKPEVTVDVVPVAVKEISGVANVLEADIPLSRNINPGVDVNTDPNAIQSPVQTKVQPKEPTPVDAIIETNHIVKPTMASAITKASMTLEQKLMAEVKAMLANTQVDMSMISHVVGQVANELSGAAVEHLPSAVQLGLETLGTDPSAKKLSKKERVSELIGSTRGVVVYPPTPPSVKFVPKHDNVKADVISKTKQIPNVATKKISQHTKSETNTLKNKKQHTTPTLVPTTKLPPHVDIPTLPPKTLNMAESPEVYRTLQTILDHNPLALVKVLENTVTQSPPGPKISIESLVDIGHKDNLANLQSILTDISTGVKTNTTNNITNTVQVTQTETQFEPLVNTTNVANKKNGSAAVDAVPKMNDIKIEPLSTLIANAHDVTYEAFSSNLPTRPIKPVESVVSTDINPPAETLPTTVNLIFTDVGNISKTTNQLRTVSTISPFVYTDTSTVATNSTTSVDIEGVPVNISELNPSTPQMANMEGVPVHMERIPAKEHSGNPENLDVTGALSILQEINSFGPNSSTSKHNAIAKKLSDPDYVNLLRNLLQTMMKKASVSTTTTPLWSEIPEFSTTSFPVSTTSLPISSTEEYEAEDFMSTTPAS